MGINTTETQTFDLEHPAFDATGFDMRQSLAGELFAVDDGEGCGMAPLLTDVDESTVCPNVFLAGPNVKHGKAIFYIIHAYTMGEGRIRREPQRGGRETCTVSTRPWPLAKANGFILVWESLTGITSVRLLRSQILRYSQCPHET
jgi:hypothetical protein